MSLGFSGAKHLRTGHFVSAKDACLVVVSYFGNTQIQTIYAGIARSVGYRHNSMMDIFRVFQVEAAHHLPNVPAGHKCARLHGHSFRIEVHVSGPVGEINGWVMDFADLRKIFQPIYDQLDHHYLNEIEGLENPTSENLARWIWQQLTPGLNGLSKIIVQETCNAGCIYYGN